MALFGKREKKKEEETQEPTESGTSASVKQKRAPSGEKAMRRKFAPTEVLRKPRITEKATALAERNVYVFNVDPRANKNVIKSAVRELYGVTPRKVNTVPVRQKRVSNRGIPGKRAGGKKAYIYLQEGDRIDTV